MNQNDIIQRFLIENANVRGELVRLTASYQTIVKQHPYPSAIQKLLGETLVAATLLSAIIKFKGRLTVQFQGKDPLKLLLAQSNENFEIRGIAQWQGDLTEDQVMELLKQSLLAIIVNSDVNAARYQGMVAWQGNSLAQSLEGYFQNSEQLPTRIWIAVNETSAAGLLLQPLPAEGTLKSQAVTADEGWDHIIHLTNTIKPEELLTLDNQTILHRLYSQEAVRVFTPEEVKFGCTCSLAKSENAILMVGKEEAEQEIKDKKTIVVTCEFCGTEYTFDSIDVANMFKKGDNKPSQIH